MWLCNLCFLCFLCFCLLYQQIGIQVSFAANWAQSSGKLKQNTVIPNIPSPSHPHWQPRFGAQLLVSSSTSNGSTLFLIGGDTFQDPKLLNIATDYSPGLIDSASYLGYKNDVWSTKGTLWYTQSNIRLRGKYNQKLPEVRSQLTWVQVSPGLLPPPGKTYDQWIRCQAFFQTKCTDAYSSQWSPRRHHAAVIFKQELWIFGGRSREFAKISEFSEVGGVIGRSIGDVVNNTKQGFVTHREVSILRNDVWKSSDGVEWILVNPGCKQSTKNFISEGNPQEGVYGVEGVSCNVNGDCYGVEKCESVGNLGQKICVCPMWSPREQHAVAVYNDIMYISGGFISYLINDLSSCGKYACGDTDGSDYRYYSNEVWASNDGLIWNKLPSTFPGRGGHKMLFFENYLNIPSLWIFGGQGIDQTNNVLLYNDVWSTTLNSSGIPLSLLWVQQNTTSITWSPRVGHEVVYEPASPRNLFKRRVFVIGGQDSNLNVLGDVWIWEVNNIATSNPAVWIQDFSPEALFKTGDGAEMNYYNNSPTINYVTSDSPLEYMQNFMLPYKVYTPHGERPSIIPYLSPSQIKMLHQVGLETIRDLANATLYQILKLRGFDVPEVNASSRLNFVNVCDFRALAIAIVKKCDVDLQRPIYDSEWRMPWNIKSVFGGPLPWTSTANSWWGVNYSSFAPLSTDAATLTSEWDGCTYVAAIQGYHGPNVDGLGIVSQVESISDPSEVLQELHCRQPLPPRAYHSAAWFEERLYVVGGKTDMNRNVHSIADTWYRDEQFPIARILVKPRSHSSDSLFEFVCDKDGGVFQYRMWDPINYKELRPWTLVTHKTSVDWLNWRKGGPSNGWYTLYVRAVDAANNRDEKFFDAGSERYLSKNDGMLGPNGNVYTWYYVSPTPWDIIAEVLVSLLVVSVVALLEYRRRMRKQAMERYAMKRMRRKFKALRKKKSSEANDMFDWRKLFYERKHNGDAARERKEMDELQLAKKMQQLREKQLLKKKQELLEREKEKERVKKKLQKIIEPGSMKSKGRKLLQDDASTSTGQYVRRRAVPMIEDDSINDESEGLQINFEGFNTTMKSRMPAIAPSLADFTKSPEKGNRRMSISKFMGIFSTDRQLAREDSAPEKPKTFDSDDKKQV